MIRREVVNPLRETTGRISCMNAATISVRVVFRVLFPRGSLKIESALGCQLPELTDESLFSSVRSTNYMLNEHESVQKVNRYLT